MGYDDNQARAGSRKIPKPRPAERRMDRLSPVRRLERKLAPAIHPTRETGVGATVVAARAWVNGVGCAIWTSTGEGLQQITELGGVGAMVLKGLAALLLLGGIVYALLSGNRGIGAITFGLGAAVLGLDRFRAARGRPERAIGRVLVLPGRSSRWTP